MNQRMGQRGVATYAAADLLRMKGAALEELFSQRRVAEIPDGVGRGTVLLTPGTFIAGRGKIVDASNGTLLNIVSPFGVKAIKANVYKDPSWFDGAECIVLDYSKTSFVARRIRDEIREVSPGVFLGIVFWGKRQVGKFALVFPTA
jgi:hypothetical protein